MSRRYPGSRIAANIERDYKIELSYKKGKGQTVKRKHVKIANMKKCVKR